LETEKTGMIVLLKVSGEQEASENREAKTDDEFKKRAG
jgi:hypothetical protein